MNYLKRLVVMAERVFQGVAALMLFAIMLIVVVDVAMRYLFNAPLGWSYGLISLYLMVGLFYFSLSDTLHHDGHVRVDILQERFSPPMKSVADLACYSSAGIVVAAMLWMTVLRTWESFQGGDVLAGAIAWPTWIAYLPVPLGLGLMLLRIFLIVTERVQALSGTSR